MDSKAVSGSLSGVKVVDLSRVLAGPYCTQMLADHGAEVVKIEPPHGDDTRQWGPPFLDENMSSYYGAVNRNKHHIAINLMTEEGRELLKSLLADADVLVENYKYGTLEKWGFSDDYLSSEYPSLIHCRITGFGSKGPMKHMPGYDAILQAFSGLMSINGEADAPPVRIGVPVVDMVTGIHAFSGILLALNERSKSGFGQRIDCSLLSTAIGLLHPFSSSWLAGGSVPIRSGSAHPSIAPYDIFQAKDGDVFIAVGNDLQFKKFSSAINAKWLSESSDYKNNSDRLLNYESLKEIINKAISVYSSDDLEASLTAVGVPISKVNSVPEALAHEQVKALDSIIHSSEYQGVGFSVMLSRTPPAFKSPPGSVGRDTHTVLSEIGYDDDEIADLIESGVIK